MKRMKDVCLLLVALTLCLCFGTVSAFADYDRFSETEYYFYVEADGNAYSEEGKRMMKELSKYCDRLRIIGSFPHEKKL